MANEQGHETREGAGYVGVGGAGSVEEARRLHHLATADPEPERDGLLTGPAHEAKYGLERAEASAAAWRAAGVDPEANVGLPAEEPAEPVIRTDAPVDAPADASSAPSRRDATDSKRRSER